MTDLSQKLYGHWSIISKALIEELKKEMSKKKSEKDNVYEERLGKTLKLLGSVSIGQINKSVKGLNIENMVNKAKGDYAYTLFDLETRPSEDIIKKMEEIKGVLKVRIVK